MSSSFDSVASKKADALIRLATDRAKGDEPPAFLTEEVRLRLEEGLRNTGLRAALLALGQRPSQAPPQAPPQQQSCPAQRPVDAFLPEEAVLRLEVALRAQREQQAGRHFFKPDATPARPRSGEARSPKAAKTVAERVAKRLRHD